ncbi:fimbrial protein [Burkholderia cepacia]|uniref:fimbrial protein n=1 Tax=Burkholderia cepacia TaxID=292 RepID=UPI0021AB0D21|nr:fimbrial protein [Burkholderia cepacia]
MRNTIFSVILFGAAVSPALAMSASDCEWGNGTSLAGNIAMYYVNGYSTPEFNPSVPIGTVLDSRTVSASGLSNTLSCSQIADTLLHGRLFGTAEPVYNTYPTTIPGVGVRIRFSNNKNWLPFTVNWGTSMINISTSSLIIEFVKVGPITAAGTLKGELAGSYVNGTIQYRSIRIQGGIEIKPKVPTCSVATKQIAVKMSPTGNDFSSKDFSGVGSTTPERDFSIQLNCTGGDLGTSTNAYVTLTDNSNSGNRSNRLSLTPNSEASGVAVQILRNGSPLNFGPDSSDASNPNQWKAGNIPQGQGVFTIPLTARYIQTGTLKGGTANAVATFTMSYQ